MNKITSGWLIPFSVACIAFAFLSAGWNAGTLVWPSVWIFVAALTVTNIDRLDRFKAGTTGVEFEVRKVAQEARDTLADVQMLAKQVAAISLSLVKRSARIGGYPPAEEERIRNDMETLLDKAGVPSTELPTILDEWHRWVIHDYIFAILGNSMMPAHITPEVQTQWKEMHKRAFQDDRPTPEELTQWLEANRFLNDDRKGYLEDYAFYLANHRHRRFDVWETHHEWSSLATTDNNTL